MCGIVGFIRLQPECSQPLAEATAQAMVAALERRGPDSGGQWRSADGLAWLGFRRLAIIDLAAGSQPMSNEDATLWVAFNGEIYNFRELRSELLARGHGFRTECDTEVLLHGCEEWGAEGLLGRLNGIFAFCLYDVRSRTVVLARDHVGVKPLYWWSDGRVLLFASEMKAMLPYPGLRDRRIDRVAAAQFLVSRYVSRPRSMFEGVHSLPEGSWLRMAVGGTAPEIRQYWDASYEPDESLAPEAALEQLDALLRDSVEMQLLSDVPVGAQLSGGVDSSLIVAYMDMARRRRGAAERIRTYSVGFDLPQYSELPHARRVAQRYGTEHCEIRIGFDDFLRELPALTWLHDTPVGQPPALPTYLMCRRAKQDVSVMLCGEGADELFGGYNKYAFEQYAGLLSWLPNALRKGALRGIGAVLPFRARRLRSILEILGLPQEADRYASWYGALDRAAQWDLLSEDMQEQTGAACVAALTDLIGRTDAPDPVSGFMYCDLHSRLVDDMLLRCDRMSMAASVEARVPFLDHRVVQFAARLPLALKVDGRRTKILLKRLAERYMPADLIYRRKVGFTVPLSQWIVGPLSGLVRDVLLSERCLARGYWKPQALRRLVNGHLARQTDREQGIWALLALELWHRLYMDDDGSEQAVERVRDSIEEQLLKAA